MSKRTSLQRMLDLGQPYTRLFPEVKYEEIEIPHPTKENETLKGLKAVPGFSVRGYTFEETLQPEVEDDGGEPTYKLDWLEHDLGQSPTRVGADEMAAEWLESLRGVYPIR